MMARVLDSVHQDLRELICDFLRGTITKEHAVAEAERRAASNPEIAKDLERLGNLRSAFDAEFLSPS